MPEKKQIITSVIYVLVIVIIIAGFVYFNKTEAPVIVDVPVISTSTVIVATSSATGTVQIIIDTPMDIFAKCVASKNLTMYGAVWCSHCLAEKKAFGESFKYVPYVECPDNIKLCTDKGINGYPTWIDGAGKKHEGEQGLSGVAKISGCVLP